MRLRSRDCRIPDRASLGQTNDVRSRCFPINHAEVKSRPRPREIVSRIGERDKQLRKALANPVNLAYLVSADESVEGNQRNASVWRINYGNACSCGQSTRVLFNRVVGVDIDWSSCSLHRLSLRFPRDARFPVLSSK